MVVKRGFSYVTSLAVTCFMIPSTTYATDLHEALAIAYENNPSLLAEQANVRSIDEDLPQAYSGWMPTASATYTIGHEREEIGERDATTGLQSVSYNRPETLQFSVNQPIFSGGETVARVKRAKNRIAGAQSNLHRIEQNVLSESVIAYVDVVRTKEVLALSKGNENVLKEQLEATQARFDLGETTRTDVAQAEARLSRATSERITADGAYIAARAEYKRVIGQAAPTDVSMPEILPEIPESYDAALDYALGNNPTLKTAEYNAEVSEADIDISVANLLPDLAVVGNVRRTDGTSDFRGGREETESVLLSLSVPIFQSGSEYSRVRQAKESAYRTKLLIRDNRNTVEELVTEAWKDVETTRATIKSTGDAVKAAKVALDGVKQEHEVGSRTVLDILDQEQELFTAQVDHVTAKRNAVVAVYNLLSALGDLTADNLALNIPVYDPNKHKNKVRYRMIGL